MTTVWAVCSGEYSDYGIECIVPDEDTANRIVKVLNDCYGDRMYGRYYTESFAEREEAPTVGSEIHVYALLDAEGNVTHQNEYEDKEHWWEEVPSNLCNSDVRQITSMGDGKKLQVSVEGHDHERVRKRFSELLAETRANIAVLWERLVK